MALETYVQGRAEAFFLGLPLYSALIQYVDVLCVRKRFLFHVPLLLDRLIQSLYKQSTFCSFQRIQRLDQLDLCMH